MRDVDVTTIKLTSLTVKGKLYHVGSLTTSKGVFDALIVWKPVKWPRFTEHNADHCSCSGRSNRPEDNRKPTNRKRYVVDKGSRSTARCVNVTLVIAHEIEFSTSTSVETRYGVKYSSETD